MLKLLIVNPRGGPPNGCNRGMQPLWMFIGDRTWRVLCPQPIHVKMYPPHKHTKEAAFPTSVCQTPDEVVRQYLVEDRRISLGTRPAPS